MSATIREIVCKAVKTALHENVVVDELAIPYFTDYFSDTDYGIFLASYIEEADDNKHHFASMVTLEFEIFGINKRVDFVAEITRKVRLLLKASVTATIQLSNGYAATYTTIPSVSSFVEVNDGKTTHRDVLRVNMRVDELTIDS